MMKRSQSLGGGASLPSASTTNHVLGELDLNTKLSKAGLQLVKSKKYTSWFTAENVSELERKAVEKSVAHINVLFTSCQRTQQAPGEFLAQVRLDHVFMLFMIYVYIWTSNILWR